MVNRNVHIVIDNLTVRLRFNHAALNLLFVEVLPFDYNVIKFLFIYQIYFLYCPKSVLSDNRK